ncbi:cyanophycinase [Gemmatimonadota bacterium]
MKSCARVSGQFLLLLLLLLAACDSGGPPEPPEPEEVPRGLPGPLVVIGGGLRSDNLPVFQAVLDGRWGNGPLCILPTASGTPTSSMDGYVSDFNAVAGAPIAQGIFLTLDNPQAAFDQDTVDRLKACSGFFFTGGVQSRILDVFRPAGQDTPAYQAVWDRYQAGAVVAGSSAGAAIMTDPMIAGGNSEGALDHGVRGQAEGEGVWLRQGMGFLPDGISDQHFLARGRWGRLLVAVLGTEAEAFGYGIDENTALVVFSGSATVVGESGVVFFDTRQAALETEGNGGYGVQAYLLGVGDRVGLEMGVPEVDSMKPSLATSGAESLPQNPDLFGSRELLRILHALGTATDTLVAYHQGGHQVELRKGAGFQARAWDGIDADPIPRGLFLGPFVLSVWRQG